MAINLFWLCAVGIIAAMAGFWSGRWSTFMQFAEGEEFPEKKKQGGRAAKPEKTRETVKVQDGEAINAGEAQAAVGRIQDMEAADAGIAQTMAGKSRDAETDNAREAQAAEKTQTTEASGQISRRQIKKTAEPKHSRERSRNTRGVFAYHRKNSAGEKRIPLGWAIGSPAEGSVYTFNDGRRKGAMVRSIKGCLYAPASGKIIKLYPLGNQMVLRTDFGVELLLRVGSVNEETAGEYFRPRILQNEIISKGKLLLEYDRERLIAEGEDTDIFVTVEEAQDYRNITVTEKTQVKQGEEILWVADHSRIVRNP